MMRQKFMLDDTQASYKRMQSRIRERIIDQSEFIKEVAEEAKEQFVFRKEEDEGNLQNINQIIIEQHELIEAIVRDVYFHMLELSSSEINSSGFVTHIITVDENTEYDKESKVIKFENAGRAEIPIATTLRKWSDASQLRILPKRNNDRGAN